MSPVDESKPLDLMKLEMSRLAIIASHQRNSEVLKSLITMEEGRGGSSNSSEKVNYKRPVNVVHVD